MLRARPNPLVHDSSSTQRIMLLVCVALLPNILASTFIFGYRALMLYAVSILACVLTEHVACKLMKIPLSTSDLSAAVTGILFAAMLPVETPYWMVIFGAIIAIGVVKMLFGGIGYNFANPAIVARIVLIIAFPSVMASYSVLSQFAADANLEGQLALGADTVSSATPLALIKNGQEVDYMTLILGTHAGSIGEVSILALAIGAVFLLITRVIEPWIPFTFIASAVLGAWALGGDPMLHLLSGGLILGACFMANDYTTSPITTKGKIIYGIGCGLITAFVRVAGFAAEGVAFAILFMNLLTPSIDKLCATNPLGGVKRVLSKQK